jgi:hypothetical protein
MRKAGPIQARTGTQISVFLLNQPGTLAEVTELLGARGVNLLALSMAEGLDHGYVRMVPDEPEEALRVLRENKYLLLEREVLLLELANRPGSLARVCRTLADAGVNIEYVYCANSPSVGSGLVVLRVDDREKARKALA